MKITFKKFTALLFVLLITAAVCGCGEGESQYNIYYKNADGTSLVKETHKTDLPEDADKTEIIAYLIGELSQSPDTEGVINTLPDGTELIKAEMRKKTAVVDLSEKYYRNQGVEELLARYSIISTLCEVDGIESVEILVEGEPLISTTSGGEIGVVSMSDVVYSPQDSSATQKVTVTLYFPDKNAEYLVPEKRDVEAQASLSTERLILTELMKGPKSSDLVQVIPSDIKVISTETKDGVCFVNLSGDLLDKVPGGSASTNMVLFSIVNSLTELDSVGSVQILIDGKAGAEFGNHVLDAPLEKNKSLIKE